jgi:DHA1 family tetracycline resistance protein-like MFS transporter
MSTLDSPAAALPADHDAPSRAQMAPLLALNFAVMSSSYAFVAVAGMLTRRLQLPAWQLGLVIALVGVLWVSSAPAWGRRTARVGHVPVLRVAVLGLAGSLLALAAYVDWALAQPVLPAAGLSLAVLLLGRGAMGGFMAGVPVAAVSWIAQHTAPSARAATMARYGAAGAVGMVVAPPLAGALAAQDLRLALLVAAVLPVLALVGLDRLRAARAAASAPPPKGARLRPLDARIRLPWFTALCLFSVAIMANLCIGFYVIDALGTAPSAGAAAAGTALGAAGLALMLSQAVMSRRPRVAPRRWLRAGLSTAALGFGSVLLAGSPWMVAGSFFVAGLGMGLCFPSVSALAANRVAPGEQPACAAAMSTAQGMSMVLAPLLGTGAYELWPAAPFVLMPLLLGAAMLAWTRGREPAAVPAP